MFTLESAIAFIKGISEIHESPDVRDHLRELISELEAMVASDPERAKETFAKMAKNVDFMQMGISRED
ncbi:hypothetical protein [Nocardia abscessus]|uniref:hypothetical protein n=1 Tax=Nocardia abscessus TaxID=120957 RepID=UPI0024545BCE|nr:hypothetical protein [Nocardia abscessus]